MPPLRTAAFALMPALAALPAAACVAEPELDAYVAAWTERTPAKALGEGASLADALCIQEALVAKLSETLGPPVGHKAGLTSEAVQARFGATAPVRGVLLAEMLLESGATVPADFGPRGLFEADLVLVVGDAAINAATTEAEVMSAVSAIRPFLELPDLAVAKGEPITPATLTAGNVGARLGVLGAEIPVEDPAAFVAALTEMIVTVTAGDGMELVTATGDVVLGHPARAVLWLLEDGVTFEAGDLVSVGSIGPLFPVGKSAGAVTVSYAGLPGTADGTATVSVVFEGLARN